MHNLNQTGELNVPQFLIQLVELFPSSFGASSERQPFGHIVYYYEQIVFDVDPSTGVITNNYNINRICIHNGNFNVSGGTTVYDCTFLDFFKK